MPRSRLSMQNEVRTLDRFEEEDQRSPFSQTSSSTGEQRANSDSARLAPGVRWG